MANMEDLEEGAEGLQVPHALEEHIEVVEQCVDETADKMVGEVKDLIFMSLLPAYTPTIPLGFEAKSLYECKECGDQFTFESSYQFHMERRSLLIRLDCPECQRVITAFNRCSLLSHLRQHGDPSDLTLDSNRVFVSPIPYNKLLIGPLADGTKTEESSLSSSALENLFTTDEVIKSCSECNIELKGEVREHFLGSADGIPVDYSHKCKHCSMILATECSLKAHERYHRRERPFVCPDCAKVFGLWASFSVHLAYCCFHFDKCFQFRCPACKVSCATSVALEVHILTMHVKNVFKCNVCPIACFSLQALEVHKVKGHGQASLPINAYQQCQLCPDRLIPKSRLLFHIIEHVRKPSVCFYGYQCKKCSVFCEKRSDFAIHKAQCSDQPKSAPVDMKNGAVLKVRNNVCTSMINPVLMNGSVCTLNGISEGSSSALSCRMLGKNSRISLLKSNDQVSNNHPLVGNVSCDTHNTNRRGDKDTDKVSEVTVVVSDTVTVADNANGCHDNVEGSSHVCDRCGQELTNKLDSLYCSKCSDIQSQSKICPRKKNNRADGVSKNAKSVSSATSTATSTTSTLNRESMNNKNTGCKSQVSSKRQRSSTLNGPCNKKTKRTDCPEIAEKDMYRCHICKTLIGTEWQTVQDHFAKEHKNYNLLVVSPNKLETRTSNTNPSPGKSGKNTRNNSVKNINKLPVIKVEPMDEEEDNPQPPKVRRSKRRLLPKETSDEEPVGWGELVSAHRQNNPDGKLTCFKCKFQSGDVQIFWSHVITHKTDSRAYQCMECGMCFVVKPSFEKHLYICHKIKDVERYIHDHSLCFQEPVSVKSESEDSSYEKDIEENQCRVCQAKFDTTIELNKHFRTHGMAFLMMKQQENRNTLNH